MMGFGLIFIPENFLAVVFGAVVGYFIGAMPGLSPSVGIALLVPFTYTMTPVSSIVMLVAIYVASQFGGAIPAILMNTPGNASAATTVLDGYPLAQQGKAATALGMSIIVSGFAAFLSAVLLIIFTLPLAAFALRFAAPEYFFLALLGLSVVSGLSSDSLTKGLMVVMLGLLITTVGMDPVDGAMRYVFTFHFLEGIPFVPAIVGLFAIAEVLTNFSKKNDEKSTELIKLEGKLPNKSELRYCMPATLRGSLIGFGIGVIPAVGANIASWFAYNVAKNTSKQPEMFGKGALDGIASCEAANSASVSGTLVPTLTLGIPGSPAAAVLMGALMLQGLQPGPLLFSRNPEIPFSVFASLLISVPIMLAIGLLAAPLFSKVVLVPKSVLSAIILGICVLGSYALTNHMFGVWVAFAFGILGFILKKLNFSVVPLVLALVLGRMAERNYRVALLMGQGSHMIFINRPLAVIIALIALVSFAYPFIQSALSKRKLNTQA